MPNRCRSTGPRNDARKAKARVAFRRQSQRGSYLVEYGVALVVTMTMLSD